MGRFYVEIIEVETQREIESHMTHPCVKVNQSQRLFGFSWYSLLGCTALGVFGKDHSSLFKTEIKRTYY